MGKPELEALLARNEIWLLIFGILVVVGVAGESIFGIRHWWNNKKLQAVQRSEDQQHAEIMARLTEETATANARAQEASKDDAQSKLELQRILDRRPFKEQREAIVSRLKEIPAVDIGIIRLTVFPPEARGLWNAFESMFSDAWGRDHVRRALLSKAGPLEGTHGILIAAVPGSQGSVRQAADDIAKLFLSVGIPIVPFRYQPLTPTDFAGDQEGALTAPLRILIGAQPKGD